MTKQPYMPLFPDAYLMDTLCLTFEEQGAYFKLLCWMWSNGGELVDDDKKIVKILSIHPNKWQKLRKSVMECFAPSREGHLTQYQLQKEYRRAHKTGAKSSRSTYGVNSHNALKSNARGDEIGRENNAPTSLEMSANSFAATNPPNPRPIPNKINQEEIAHVESCGKQLEPLLPSERAIAFTMELARNFEHHGLTMPSDFTVVAGWLRKGADPDKDILPVIDNILSEIARKQYPMPQSWKYFGKAVFASVRKRNW